MTADVNHLSAAAQQPDWAPPPVHNKPRKNAPSRPELRPESIGGPELRVVGGEDTTSITGRVRNLSALRAGVGELSHPWVKRAFDIIGALILALVFSPLIIALTIIIRLEGGTALFRHPRVGREGKVFHCLKFRTMVSNAEEVLRDLLAKHPEIRDEWTQNHKLRTDPRITAVGRVLRLTSLDELPQLWNVLRGDMSLVGPRPIVRAELLRYGRWISTYLAVKPGLTGLWQVKGRSDTTYRRRVAMDMYYIQHQNLLLDFYILLNTTTVVLKRAGAY